MSDNVKDGMTDAPGRRKGHGRWIWRMWKERPWLVILLLVLSLISSAVAVAFPYLYKILLDGLQARMESGASEENLKEANRIAILVLTVGVGSFVASLFPGIRAAMNVVFEYLLRSKYFGIALGRDYRSVSSFRTGDLATRLTDDVSADGRLSWFLCSGIFRAVEAAAKIVFCLAAMFAMDWKLTLYSLIPLPFMIGIFWFAEERIHDTFKRNQEAISDINSQLEMSFSGVRVIKANASERKYGRFFEAALGRRAGTEMALAKLDALLVLVYQYIDYFAQIALVFAGGLAAARGELGIGTFYAFYNYLGMLVYPILDIPQLFISGKRSFVNIDRLEELSGEAPDPVGPAERSAPAGAAESVAPATSEDFSVSSDPEEPAPSAGTLRVRGLRFAYPGAAMTALDGISFDLPPGSRLAVLGPVGSGKSTLLKLLCGVLSPESGSIRTTGAKGEPTSFSAMFGYVPQDPSLFSGTVRDNIAFGASGDGMAVSDEEYGKSVRIAQMEAEIGKMPEGEKTQLGQRGANISGGQKQRLAIARAVARHPRILLLDDITASLDAANEEKLMKSLADWSADLSCVMVSHRLSTVRFSDRVLFLESGKIAGFGTHDELVATNEEYRAFIRSRDD